jgi:hypothetical protein
MQDSAASPQPRDGALGQSGQDAGERTVPVERFNGLMSSMNRARYEATQAREEADALRSRLAAYERGEDPDATHDDHEAAAAQAEPLDDDDDEREPVPQPEQQPAPEPTGYIDRNNPRREMVATPRDPDDVGAARQRFAEALKSEDARLREQFPGLYRDDWG